MTAPETLVRLAVFTAKYPARVSTFFERDMLSLMAAGVDLRIFPIHPIDHSLWPFALDDRAQDGLRDRAQDIGALDVMRGVVATTGRSPLRCAGQAMLALGASMRYGPVPFAKTGYVLPKAWAWAAQEEGRFDHVLAYWGNYAGTCAWAFHQAIGGRVPFSIWLHAGTDLYARPILLERKMRYADNIITCCDFNRTYLAQHFPRVYPEIESRVAVCHHGLDLAKYPYKRTGRVHDRIVAVGRLSKYKGFEYLIEAVALLAASGKHLELDLVGGGDLHGQLQRHAERLGVARQVRFRGWVPHDVVRSAMQDGTLLVHPSDGLGDGLPNVVREAMALGLPVVASAVAGLPDALGDGCGLLVPPRDPASLAAAIASVITHPERANEMAARARGRVEREYDVWQNGRRLAALLSGTRRAPHPAAPPARRLEEAVA